MVNEAIIVIGPGLSMGGVERSLSNLLNGFAITNKSKKVLFISIFKKNKFYFVDEQIEIIEPDDYNIDKLDIIKTISFIRNNVIKISKKNIIFAIIVYGKFYGALTTLSLLGNKFSIIVSDRQSPYFKWPRKIRIFNKIAYQIKPPKGVIAQTKIAAEYQRKYYGKKIPIKIIPNSVRDVKLYPEIKRENIILAVGRLNDYLKGFDLLLESIALLENKDWELHIAGGDEDGDSLKEQARRLGIRDRVKFLGKVKDIDKCYAKAGIFVIPSRSEGFPNALLEAMAAGCCCVAFDFIAGPRDIIKKNENGIIIEYANVKILAKEIDLLINDEIKRKYLSINAIKVRNKYSNENIIKEIEDLINSYRN